MGSPIIRIIAYWVLFLGSLFMNAPHRPAAMLGVCGGVLMGSLRFHDNTLCTCFGAASFHAHAETNPQTSVLQGIDLKIGAIYHT